MTDENPTYPIMTEGSVRTRISGNLDTLFEEIEKTGDWSNYWRYMVSIRNMERGGAFGLMEGLSRALRHNSNKEDLIQQAIARLDLDEDTVSRYMRIWGMYERPDFQALDPALVSQVQDLPVDWQRRIMQNVSDGFEVTTQYITDLLGAKSLRELNHKLKERRGGPNKAGRTWSITPTGEVYSWYNGDYEGQYAVWTGPTDTAAYDDFKRKLGITGE